MWDEVAALMETVPTIGGQRYVDRHRQARQDAGPRADRGAGRPEHAVPRTLGARRLGDRGPGRRRCRPGHRRGRRCRVRHHRNRHEREGRRRQPDHLEEGSAFPRDRPREPAPADQPQRIRRRRPAPAGRPLHPGGCELQGADPAVQGRDPDHHRGLRTEHGRRRVHPGDERLHDLRQGGRDRLPRRPAAREDGDRRDRRRGDARWRRDALADVRAVRLLRAGRDGRVADHPPDRAPPAVEEARPGPDRTRRRPAVRPDGAAGLRIGRRRASRSTSARSTPACSTAAASRSSRR